MEMRVGAPRAARPGRREPSPLRRSDRMSNRDTMHRQRPSGGLGRSGIRPLHKKFRGLTEM